MHGTIGLPDARMHAASGGHGRLVGLDGLRAIAVMAVFLFHADLSWARGGYLGVDLFFVISGFLITGLLARESEANGRLNLGAFYWRRAKRLLPASYLMTGAAIIAAAFWAPDALSRLRSDTVASLFYVTNWELIFSGRSYFEAMGRQPLLLHLWSLAIEEQFYILWAPVLFFVLPRFGKRVLIGLAGALAVASAVWMSLKAGEMGYPGTGDPSRLYFGTDTHGFPLLIGAALGLLWQPGDRPNPAGRLSRGAVVALGGAALLAMLGLMTAMGEETAWLYPWGFLGSAGISVVLITTATWPGSAFGRVLDTDLMRWIGERSYGIYLWHWPILMLTRPDLDLHLDPVTIFVLRVGLTLGLAALSYRFVEMPIRRGLLERLSAARQDGETRRRAWLQSGVLATAGVAAVAALTAVLLVAPMRTPIEMAAAASPATLPGDETPIAPPPSAPGPATAALSPADNATGPDITAIGDSVLLGAGDKLQNQLVGIDIDAVLGRQAKDLLKDLQTLHDTNRLRRVVVLHLGTNGYVTEDQLRAMLALLADRDRVVVINTHVPRRWMDPNNQLLDRVVPDYPNVVLADWRAASDGKTEYFYDDGVHLTVRGQAAFVAEIIRAGHLLATPPLPKPKAVAKSVPGPGPVPPPGGAPRPATARPGKPVSPS